MSEITKINFIRGFITDFMTNFQLQIKKLAYRSKIKRSIDYK